MPYFPPLIADFCMRLSFGLAAMLLVTSWQRVPLPFFRTQCQVILGLTVLAALDVFRSVPFGAIVWLALAGAGLAYLATVSWGLGLVRIAQPATWLITLGALAWLALASQTEMPAVWAFNTTSRLASGALLGATLTAMLLGHHYLTAPAMSIEPLRRFVRVMAVALLARGLLAVAGLWLAHVLFPGEDLRAGGNGASLLLAARWVMGFAGPAVATGLAWKTVEIRSTQSATGILYAATALVLFGELTSLVGVSPGGLLG